MRNLLLILLATSALYSCKAIQEARDRKALGRVLTNQSLLDKAYQVGVGLHPTFPETTYVKGKDSVRIDSVSYPVVDTLLIKEKCKELNIDSLKRLLTRTVYYSRVDTFYRQDTVLRRQYDLLLTEKYYLQGQLLAVDGQLTQAQKTATKRLGYIWLTGVAGGLLVLLLTYFLIRRNGKL